MDTIISKIIRRIRAKKRGWVFTPKDFLDIGKRDAVDKVMSRLVTQGMIRRLGRGVYDFPKQHAVIGNLAPDTDNLAKAIAGNNEVAPSGAMAANMLGISTQVPMKPVYLTNGQSRSKKIGTYTINLKRARIPLQDNISLRANLVLQALSYVGKDNIDDTIIGQCARQLDAHDKQALLHKACQHVPGWMSDIIHKF